VIEAIPENVALKKELFQKIDKIAPQRAIFTSNTSYQNISEIASATNRQDRFIGTHFFNPLAVIKLLEVEPGSLTSSETLELILALARKLGKEPLVCKDWSYGFLANRLYTAMVLEAVQCLWERVATPQEIDSAVVLGYGLPRGPLEVQDIVGGWAVMAASEDDAMREIGPEKGHLHPLVRMMKRAGYNNIYKFWEDILSKW
jgi:3-hydroxybutyryl-CoA dehydrogenase